MIEPLRLAFRSSYQRLTKKFIKDVMVFTRRHYRSGKNRLRCLTTRKMLRIVSTDVKKRLKHKADYLAFSSNTISGDHAKNFPGEEVSKENSAVHPAYHPVYQPKTQGKIRVVFICRVEFQANPSTDASSKARIEQTT